MRKQVPQPPRYFNYDIDNCYFCNNRNGCHGCKILKDYIKIKGKKRDKKAVNIPVCE